MSETAGRRTNWWRLLRNCLGILAAFYLGALVLLLWFENALLYHPVTDQQAWTPPPAGAVVEDVWVQTADGTRLHGWWFPRPGATEALLYCHGNAGNLSMRGATALELQQAWGVSVLLFDYPGYGKSGGRVTEAGCYAAADAMHDWLTQTQQLPAERIILYGKSLGGGPATDLAVRRPHRMLVLCKAFTSVPEIGQTLYPIFPIRWLAQNKFDNLTKLSSCQGPVAVAAGDCDELIPLWMAEKLYAAAPAPKRFFLMPGCGHNDRLPSETLTGLAEFLRETGK